MRRIVPIVVVFTIAGIFVGTLLFLYSKSQELPDVFVTERPAVRDIVQKSVASGSVVPRQEIEIKSRVSGVVAALHVEPGQIIDNDALIADIRIIPDMLNLNRAEAAVKAARIRFDNAKNELARHRNLHERQLLSDSELSRFALDFELRQQELQAAMSDLQLVKEGAARGTGKVSNQVRATVAGTVLEVPVKKGESVIESNTFNAGTTVATIADMNDMIFLGMVDESEVGKLEIGMELDIRIGALEGTRLHGVLEYIAPKGQETEGVIEFEIRAAVKPPEDITLRAGYSANADIVLERRTQVLAIDESLLQFEDGTPYVEVETEPQSFERRQIELGLSDGIYVEVTGGVDADTDIKRPHGDGAAKQARGRG